MIWGPVILAVVFGLLISALLHFVLVWPKQEPPDDGPDEDSGLQ